MDCKGINSVIKTTHKTTHGTACDQIFQALSHFIAGDEPGYEAEKKLQNSNFTAHTHNNYSAKTNLLLVSWFLANSCDAVSSLMYFAKIVIAGGKI